MAPICVACQSPLRVRGSLGGRGGGGGLFTHNQLRDGGDDDAGDGHVKRGVDVAQPAREGAVAGHGPEGAGAGALGVDAADEGEVGGERGEEDGEAGVVGAVEEDLGGLVSVAGVWERVGVVHLGDGADGADFGVDHVFDVAGAVEEDYQPGEGDDGVDEGGPEDCLNQLSGRFSVGLLGTHWLGERSCGRVGSPLRSGRLFPALRIRT